MFKTISFSKKAFIIMLICFEASFVSCQDKIIKNELINKNPVEYVFNTPKDSLIKAILKKHNFGGLSVMTIKNKRIIPPDILELLLQTNNDQDIFLWSIGVYGKSKIYQNKNGEFVDYRVSFYIHIETVETGSVRVYIKTIEPKIVVGKEWFPGPPHFVRKDKTLPVEPSTIEEYEILLEIGKLVGEKDMPPIHLPTKK